MARTRRPGGAQGAGRGMTLIEMTVATAIFAILVMMVNDAMTQAIKSHSGLYNEKDLEDYGRKAMDYMMQELRMAGPLEHPDYVSGSPNAVAYAYPYIGWRLTNPRGEAGITVNSPQGPYAHYAADMFPPGGVSPSGSMYNAERPVASIGTSYMAADPADSWSNAIVFRLPVADPGLNPALQLFDGGTQLPVQWDTDALGNTIVRVYWGGRLDHGGQSVSGDGNYEIVYILVDDAQNDGNVLERRVWDRAAGQWVARQEICRFVECAQFRNFEYRGVDYQNYVEIRLRFRKRDEYGHWIGAEVSSIVPMLCVRGYEEIN